MNAMERRREKAKKRAREAVQELDRLPRDAFFAAYGFDTEARENNQEIAIAYLKARLKLMEAVRDIVNNS